MPKVIFLPDEYLAQLGRAQTDVEIIAWAGPLRGARALHRRRDPRAIATATPASSCWRIPECPPDVLAEADFVGSTAAMIGYVGATRPAPRAC